MVTETWLWMVNISIVYLTNQSRLLKDHHFFVKLLLSSLIAGNRLCFWFCGVKLWKDVLFWLMAVFWHLWLFCWKPKFWFWCCCWLLCCDDQEDVVDVEFWKLEKDCPPFLVFSSSSLQSFCLKRRTEIKSQNKGLSTLVHTWHSNTAANYCPPHSDHIQASLYSCWIFLVSMFVLRQGLWSSES